jgi:hypothetical protein
MFKFENHFWHQIVTCWVYVTRQITSRCLGSSEFIPLALTFIQFTITQVLPSAVSHLLLLLESLPFLGGLNSLQRMLDCNWLRRLHDPHCVTPDHTLTGHILLSWLFILFPVALCYQHCPLLCHCGGRGLGCLLTCYQSSGSAPMLLRHCWWGR